MYHTFKISEDILAIFVPQPSSSYRHCDDTKEAYLLTPVGFCCAVKKGKNS